eukprot:5911529-Pyramimonas_sp.AAC.1
MQAHPQLFASGEHSGNTRGCHMPGYMFYALRVSFTHGVRYMGPPRCLFPFECGCGGGVPTLEGLTGVLAEAVWHAVVWSRGGAAVGEPSLGEQERPGGGSSRRHDG